MENGVLYVVATPIGNLDDFSPRAKAALEEVAAVAAEDTRNTMNLLRHFGIKKPMYSYHKFNEVQRSGELVSLLLQGMDLALVSDAGTPGISDPGAILVQKAAEAGIQVVGIPGPCAAVTALSVSGFPLDAYAFYGFLPRENTPRKKALRRMQSDGAEILVLYEAPKRIKATVSLLGEEFPGCALCVLNDLTKHYEAIYRGSASAVLEALEANPSAEKGEYTIVLKKAGRPTEKQEGQEALSVEAMLIDVMVKEGCSLRDAVARIAGKEGGPSRKQAYAASLHIKSLLAAGQEDGNG